jgi:hypothetical protein
MTNRQDAKSAKKALPFPSSLRRGVGEADGVVFSADQPPHRLPAAPLLEREGTIALAVCPRSKPAVPAFLGGLGVLAVRIYSTNPFLMA